MVIVKQEDNRQQVATDTVPEAQLEKNATEINRRTEGSIAHVVQGKEFRQSSTECRSLRGLYWILRGWMWTGSETREERVMAR